MGACTSKSSAPAECNRKWNPRLYHDNDSYLQRFVAVSQPFHCRLLRLIDAEGCDAARFPEPSVFRYDESTILHTIRGTPFNMLYKFIAELGLTPQIFLEPLGEHSAVYTVCSVGSLEDIDWITLFLSDSAKLRRLCTLCDLSLSNFGHMLIVTSKTFKYSDRTSLSSTLGQYGSASNLILARKQPPPPPHPCTSLLKKDALPATTAQ